MSSEPPTLGGPSDQHNLYHSFPNNEIPQDDAPSRKRPRYLGTTDSSEQPWLTNKFSKYPTNDRFGGQLNISPMDSVSIHTVHGNSSRVPELQPAINLPGKSRILEYQPGPVHERVTIKQRKFMRRWYKGFLGERGQQAYLSNDHVKALATLIDLRPQTVHNWICQNLIDPSGSAQPEEAFIFTGLDQEASLESGLQTPNGPDTSNSNENSHLSREIIQLIESHVETCNNKRARSDGRRRVNVGKYECTFGCGYRTKRAFDWKRHEENHQPQNFWLCSVCRQREMPRYFLVHRNDKLLKHIQDKHAGYNPEDAVKSSEVAYKANFKLQCGFCGHTFESWEERNKHILQHFDGEGGAALSMSQWRDPWYDEEEEDSDEDQNSSSSSSSGDSSDDEDPDQHDATGGAWGESGTRGSQQPPNKRFSSSRGRGGTTSQSTREGDYYARDSGTNFTTHSHSRSVSKVLSSMRRNYSSTRLSPITYSVVGENAKQKRQGIVPIWPSRLL